MEGLLSDAQSSSGSVLSPSTHPISAGYSALLSRRRREHLRYKTAFAPAHRALLKLNKTVDSPRILVKLATFMPC